MSWFPRAAHTLCATALVAAACGHAAPAFRGVTLDDKIEIGYGLAIADVDGDGRPDIVLADKQRIVWYHNPEWRRSTIAERLTELDDVCVAARDIDGDGKAEIAAGAGWNPGDTFTSGALFFLQAPADRSQPWQPIRLAHDPTIHRIRWVRNAAGGFDLLSVPLHGRGNKNGAGDGVRILAYHPPADRNAAWTTTVLHADWHATHNFDVVQNPPNQAEGLLIAGKEGVLSWTATEGGGRVRIVATNGPAMSGFVGAGEVRAGRLGTRVTFAATIEPMHGNQVVIYRTPPAENAGLLWERQVIDDTLVDGHGLACGDLLHQKRDQVVAGWRAMNRPGSRVGIRLYTPADEGLKTWTTDVIDDNEMACEDLQLADLDADGDLDLIASGRATRNLKVYFNDSPRP